MVASRPGSIPGEAFRFGAWCNESINVHGKESEQMSIDEKLAGLAVEIRNPTEGFETVFEVAEELEGGKRLVVERRKLQPEPPNPPIAPTRAESPPRQHEFHSVETMIAFLDKYGTPDTVVLCDLKNRKFEAILDSTSQTGFEFVSCVLHIHPIAARWIGILNRSIEVQDFAVFVMQNRRSIVDPDGLELAYTFSQVRAAVSIRREIGKGAKSINGLMVETVINGTKQNAPVDLPQAIAIQTPIFLGGDAYSVEIDLMIDADSDGDVSVVATCSDLDSRMLEACEGMVEQIQRDLPNATVGLGQPRFGNWKYLPASASEAKQ